MMLSPPCWIAQFGKLFFALLLVSTFSILSASAAGSRHGGTMIIALEADPPNLNVNLVPDTIGLVVSSNIFNLLVYMNFDFRIIPELAESWRISEDGLSYKFNLAKNVTWHDGKPFTSADVVYTLEHIMPQTPRAGIWWTPNVKSVEAPDSSTVLIRLKQPYSPFLTLIGNPVGGPHILPKHLYEGTDLKRSPYNDRPIGTGAFMFKDRVRGDYIDLVRNLNYFRKGKEGKPYVDRLVFKIMPDSAARILAMKKGEVDFIHSYAIPLDEIPRLKKEAHITVDKRGNEMLASIAFLLFNLRNPPLQNKPVREAIAHAVDKKQIVNLVLGGEGKAGKSFIHSDFNWAYNPKVKELDHDLQKANALLEKAAYPRGLEGIRFKLRLAYGPGRPWEGLTAEVIRDQLKQVGIDIQIVPLDRATILDTVFMKWDFDIVLQQLATGPEPTINVTRFLHSAQIKKAAYVNVMGYSNLEVDKLLDAEYKQIDAKKRSTLWHQIQEMVMEDLPLIPIYELPIANTYRSVWQDVITSPYGTFQSREHAYIRE